MLCHLKSFQRKFAKFSDSDYFGRPSLCWIFYEVWLTALVVSSTGKAVSSKLDRRIILFVPRLAASLGIFGQTVRSGDGVVGWGGDGSICSTSWLRRSDSYLDPGISGILYWSSQQLAGGDCPQHGHRIKCAMENAKLIYLFLPPLCTCPHVPSPAMLGTPATLIIILLIGKVSKFQR